MEPNKDQVLLEQLLSNELIFPVLTNYKYHEIIMEGQNAFNSKSFDYALQVWHDATILFPGKERAHRKMAYVYEAKGMLKEAAYSYLKVSALAPENKAVQERLSHLQNYLEEFFHPNDTPRKRMMRLAAIPTTYAPPINNSQADLENKVDKPHQA